MVNIPEGFEAVPNTEIPDGFEVVSDTVDTPQEGGMLGGVADFITEGTTDPNAGFVKKAVAGGMKNVLESRDRTPPGMAMDFWTGAAGTSVEKIAKDLFNTKGDVAGSVAGGMTGQKYGAVAGLPGRVGGGILGGILGSTAGKQVDQEIFGTQESQDLSSDFLQSTKEEFTGRALAWVGKPVVSLADSVVNKLSGNRVGVTAPKTIDDLFLKDESGRTIQEAEKNLTGDNVLTTFEATGGKAGGPIQAELDSRAVIAGKNAITESATLKTRGEIYNKIRMKLEPSTTQESLSQGIKDGLVFAKDSFDRKLGTIDKVLIPGRSKVKIDISDTASKDYNGIANDLADIRSSLLQKLGSKKGNQLASLVDNALTEPIKGMKGIRQYRDNINLEEMIVLKASIEDFLGDTSDTVLKKKADAAYSSFIKPIFEKYESLAKSKAKGNTKKIFDLADEHSSLAKARRAIIKSRIAKRIGVTEDIQSAKALKIQKVEDVVFESPQTWKEAQDLFDTIGHPEVAGVLQDRFKQNIVKDLFTIKGTASTAKVESLLKKHGDELIRDVAGDNYLQALKDTRLVTAALSETAGLERLVRSAGGDENVTKDLRRAFILPLARRVGIFNLVTTGLKKSVGFEVRDDTLLKAFQGEKGQALVEKMMNAPLADPASYNVYVQAVREVNKIAAQNNDNEVPLLDRKTYLEKSFSGILAIMKGLEE